MLSLSFRGFTLTPTATQIARLLDYFEPHFRDVTTFKRLQRVARNPSKWGTCYSLFQRIRSKTLRADKRNDLLLQHQYSFEEICAKTLYNLSVPIENSATAYPAPFDEDSPEYVVPIANGLADYLNIARFEMDAIPNTETENRNSR